MSEKVCIIGFGGMGKRHGKDLEEFTDGEIEIAGVFDPDDTSYDKGCEWMGKKPERFYSVHEMLENVKPDGAVIASPNFKHLESLLEFEGQNIPLILEKPLDTSHEKVLRIIDFINKYNAPVMVHHVMRYSPIVIKAKEIIESGMIGKLAGFEMVQFIHGAMFHNFRRTFKTGGGQLLEKATHDFDVLLFLTGAKPKRVAAICKCQYYGGDMPNDLTCSECIQKSECVDYEETPSTTHDTTNTKDLCVFAKEIDIYDIENCLIELDNGVSGTYSECFFSKSSFSRRYEFLGTEGFLALDFSKGNILLNNHEGEKVFSFDYKGRIHYNGAPGVAAHFLDLMKGVTSKVISPVDDAYAAEQISFAAYESNRTGSFINISM